MPNPLFEAIGKRPAGRPNNMLTAFQQFKRAFSGDPEQQVQALLASGEMTQDQYNQLAQMASGLMSILK